MGKMRNWYKYLLVQTNENASCAQDQSPDDYRRTMQGYRTEHGYQSKAEFFDTYFTNGEKRHAYYYNYIKQNVSRECRGLSIGSGRCITELKLIDEGYNIICSDLENYCEVENKRLFPDLKFDIFDVRKSGYPRKLDYILCLNMLYLFDKESITTVFENMERSLKNGGTLIVDISGAEDNRLSYFLDNYLCKYDIRVQYFLKQFIKQQNNRIVEKFHGYRYTNKDIIAIATKTGFNFTSLTCLDFVTELKQRLLLFAHLPDRFALLFGRKLPNIRLFQFTKGNEVPYPDQANEKYSRIL